MDKPIHVKPAYYATAFEPLKEIARKYGYNLVIHGSINRDLDLIAIPWQEELGSREEMIKEMADWAGGEILADAHREMYHGRICYVINIYRGEKFSFVDPQWYFDISVTPVVPDNY